MKYLRKIVGKNKCDKLRNEDMRIAERTYSKNEFV